MAIYKEIINDNGIILNYHRITSLNVITNQQNVIEISSYTSEEKRQEEIDALVEAQETGQYPETNIYIETTFLTLPYNQTMSIDSAYEYLKTLDDFKNGEDV